MQMGMHTEQLAGRTQQRLLLGRARRRTSSIPTPTTSTSTSAPSSTPAGCRRTAINLKIRELMSQGNGTIVVHNPGAKHSLGGRHPQPAEALLRGQPRLFRLRPDRRPQRRIKGRVGWSCAENMLAGTVVIEKNAGSCFGAAIRGGDLVCKGDVGARTGIDQKGGTIIDRRPHRRLLRLHDAARPHGHPGRRRQEPRRFDV